MTFLSPHFSLEELTRSSTAQENNIDNTPSSEEIVRLTKLCIEYLEPARAEFGPIGVSSGFRCAALNSLINGAAASAHVFGCAADLHPIVGSYTPLDLAKWFILKSGLDFDQVIMETPGYEEPWCHLGILRPGDPSPRKEALRWDGRSYVSWVL